MKQRNGSAKKHAASSMQQAAKEVRRAQNPDTGCQCLTEGSADIRTQEVLLIIARMHVLGGSGNIRMLDLSPHSFVSEVVTNDSHHPRQGSVQAKGRVCVRLNAPVDQKPSAFLCISSYSYSSNGLYLANSILNAASPCVNDRTASAYPIRFESGTSA